MKKKEKELNYQGLLIELGRYRLFQKICLFLLLFILLFIAIPVMSVFILIVGFILLIILSIYLPIYMLTMAFKIFFIKKYKEGWYEYNFNNLWSKG